MKKIFFLLFTTLLLISCTSKTEKKQSKKEINNRKSAQSTQKYLEIVQSENEKILKNYVENLSLEKKVAQLFIENLEGNKNFRSYENFSVITEKEEDADIPLVAGGYLFFSYNLCNSPEEQKLFMESIREYSLKNNQIPPYLAIDQEGGLVNRLKKLTGGLLSQEEVAQTMNVYECYELYSNQAIKMKNMGFHMNIAPVIEVCTEDNREFLDGRSFGNFDQTITYGKSCVFGYENNGIATVIKHFPGNTNMDPHTGLPEILLSEDDLLKSIESFRHILSNNPSAILMSHARSKVIDEDMPACLSKVWVSDFIRDKYNFQGLIFSDDIFMGALADNGYPPEKAAIMAIDAGVNCIMTSEKRFGRQAKVIYKHALENEDFYKKIDVSIIKILKFKIDKGIITYEELK